MLTSPLPARLLEGLAGKIAVCCRHMDSPLETYAFILGFGVRPPHDGDAGDNPDTWVPATQLKGHNEQV
jgi:hypothetical protein